MNVYERIYKGLSDILGDLEQLPEYAKMESGGYMDLNMDLISQNKDEIVIALSHYYKHPSGDMIADPDMEIRIIPSMKMAEALAYQDTYGYQRVYWTDDLSHKMHSIPREKKSQNSFLVMWLRNLKNQGFKREGEALLPLLDTNPQTAKKGGALSKV